MDKLARELAPLERLLDAAVLRQRVIGQNIANQDTPGYTRRVVAFEEELRGSTARIPEVRPEVRADAASPRGADGNNVQFEREWADMEKNQVLHDLLTRALGARFRTYLAAIRGQ